LTFGCQFPVQTLILSTRWLSGLNVRITTLGLLAAVLTIRESASVSSWC